MPVIQTGLPVIQPLGKVLIPLGLTAVASTADAGIRKKILESGHNTTLIISNDKMKDILETVRSLEDSGLLLKGVSDTIKKELVIKLKMKLKNKKEDFLVCY